MPKLSTEERFWSKVDRSGGSDACWPWLAACTKIRECGRGGYGTFWLNGKTIPAHRAAWLLFVGPLEEGEQVLHHCDARNCVNFERHLFTGDNGDNMADRDAKGRQARGETNGFAKLTEAEASEIRAIGTAMSSRDVGKLYGVSHGAVLFIRKGATWKHLGS